MPQMYSGNSQQNLGGQSKFGNYGTTAGQGMSPMNQGVQQLQAGMVMPMQQPAVAMPPQVMSMQSGMSGWQTLGMAPQMNGMPPMPGAAMGMPPPAAMPGIDMGMPPSAPMSMPMPVNPTSFGGSPAMALPSQPAPSTFDQAASSASNNASLPTSERKPSGSTSVNRTERKPDKLERMTDPALPHEPPQTRADSHTKTDAVEHKHNKPLGHADFSEPFTFAFASQWWSNRHRS